MKKKNPMTKSAAIRSIHKHYPALKPKEIADAVKRRYKISVKPQYVSLVLSNDRSKSKPQRSAVVSAGPSVSCTLEQTVDTVEVLLLAKELVRVAGGGASEAKKAVDDIVKLLG